MLRAFDKAEQASSAPSQTSSSNAGIAHGGSVLIYNAWKTTGGVCSTISTRCSSPAQEAVRRMPAAQKHGAS